MYDEKDVKESDNTLHCLCLQAEKTVPVYTIKSHRGAKVQLYFLLTSTPDGG
jgi:hypothetical protein